jgi:Homeodomain-like domain
LYRALLQDARFYGFELEVDRQRAADTRAEGCQECGGALHAGDFHRKPRGGPAGLAPECDVRFSFCCAEDGCRTRHTPPSLRFLGRKVYLGAVVVVVSAMRHGATPARMRKLRDLLGVSRRTVERWRRWWREVFAQSPFWRIAAAAFAPPVETSLVPASLLERFSDDDTARLVGLLRFLGPITGGAGLAHAR